MKLNFVKSTEVASGEEQKYTRAIDRHFKNVGIFKPIYEPDRIFWIFYLFLGALGYIYYRVLNYHDTLILILYLIALLYYLIIKWKYLKKNSYKYNICFVETDFNRGIPSGLINNINMYVSCLTFGKNVNKETKHLFLKAVYMAYLARTNLSWFVGVVKILSDALVVQMLLLIYYFGNFFILNKVAKNDTIIVIILSVILSGYVVYKVMKYHDEFIHIIPSCIEKINSRIEYVVYVNGNKITGHDFSFYIKNLANKIDKSTVIVFFIQLTIPVAIAAVQILAAK